MTPDRHTSTAFIFVATIFHAWFGGSLLSGILSLFAFEFGTLPQTHRNSFLSQLITLLMADPGSQPHYPCPNPNVGNSEWRRAFGVGGPYKNL